jgi:MinD-like ATPase involved in chromosome partitioning or flagellar assembly
MTAVEDRGATLATNDDPTPPSTPPELDDIDSRAAQLMAQMAERRQQMQEPQPDPVDDGPPGSEMDHESDLQPAESHEFEFQPVEYDEPAEPVDSVIEDVAMPTDDDSEIEPHQSTAHQPPVADDAATPQHGGKHRSARRMAPPPWQTSTSSMGRAIDPIPDSMEQATEAETPPAEHDDPQAFPGPPSSDMMPPPGWQPGMPLPGPGWQVPPPGWPPGFPPLPPGWQGPPPWMPPAGQGWPPYPTPEQMSAQPPDRNGSAPTSQPAQPRRGRHHAGPREQRSPAQSTDYAEQQVFQGPPSLDEAEVLGRDQYVPQSGWRRAVHKVTGGRVNPGVSRKEGELQDLLEQIRQPIVGDFRIAVLSIKGGVGKTTTTLGLGSALAMVRADRVIAVDANPDRGTLAERVSDMSTSSTVRDLLRDPNIRRYADVRSHTRLAPSRLEVLASEQDPAVAEVFGETDYRCTMDILRQYYNVILTDCGTGIMHSAMAGVLDLAHAIVLVSSPAIDAARSASATLDWLEQHGHGDLVREAHVVLSAAQPASATLKLEKVFEHFESRCGSLHEIPFEPHLAEGADFDFGMLRPETTQAYLELAGAVAEKFSRLRSPDGPR